jgi:ferredoxin-NADP reductase
MGLSEFRPPAPLITVRLSRISNIGVDTRLFELSSPGGEPLPPAAAGAHIDVHLAAGLVRQYSVITPLSTPSSYTIAVKRELAGRGGSRRLHDEITVGSRLQIAEPRNNFPLNEGAGETILFAGGIGITPIYGMLERLREIKRSVHLHYWSRSPEHTLFRDRLEKLPDATLHYAAPERATLTSVVQLAGPEDELYCCGPTKMLQEFWDATKLRSHQRLHMERFLASPDEEPASEFTVVLAKSGTEVLVRPGQTILNALLDARMDVSYSCEEGVCGACEVRFLAGVPVHRDAVRTAAEHDRLSTVMICCAHSRSKRLTLDL